MQLKMGKQEFTVRRILGLILVLAAALFSERYFGDRDVERIEGRPRLVDGDSFKMGGREVRMVGIDAPEGRQQCQKQGRAWPCGHVATEALRQMIGGRMVTCTIEGRDKHRRLLATCSAGGRNLNQAMVARGHAVAFGRRYRGEERAAKSAKRGLWAGEFQKPRDWRRQHLGAVDG